MKKKIGKRMMQRKEVSAGTFSFFFKFKLAPVGVEGEVGAQSGGGHFILLTYTSQR